MYINIHLFIYIYIYIYMHYLLMYYLLFIYRTSGCEHPDAFRAIRRHPAAKHSDAKQQASYFKSASAAELYDGVQ